MGSTGLISSRHSVYGIKGATLLERLPFRDHRTDTQYIGRDSLP